MDAPFKTIGEVNAYEENEVVKIQARGLPEATACPRPRIGFGIIIQYRTGNEGIRMDSSRKVLFTPRVL